MNNHTLLAHGTTGRTRYSVIHTPHTPFSIVSRWFNIGSYNDPNNKQGMAHLFEHIYMISLCNNINKQKCMEYIERRGMIYDAYTSKEQTGYILLQAPNNTMSSLTKMLNGFNSYDASTIDIEFEKSIILDEIRRRTSNPVQYIHTIANKGTWYKSKHGRETLGTSKSISGISADQVTNFWNNNYMNASSNLVAMTPNTDISFFKKQLVKYSCKAQQMKPKQRSRVLPKPLSTISEHRDQEVVYIAVSFRIDPIIPEDSAGIDLIRDYLSNGWTSRFVQILRIKTPETYWVNGFTIHFGTTGCVRFVFTVKKNRLIKVLNCISSEIDRLALNGISNRDLEKTKQILMLRFNLRTLQPEHLMNFYTQKHVLDTNKPFLYQDYLKLINNLTKDDIKNIANKYMIRKNSNIAMLGNVTEHEVDSIVHTSKWNG